MTEIAPSIHSQELFAEELAQYIIAKTAGTHLGDKVILNRPRDYYIIGTLAPKRKASPQYKKYQEGKTRAQMLKVSFLATTSSINQKSEISIEATGNVYYRVHLDKNRLDENRQTSGVEKKVDLEDVRNEPYEPEQKKGWKRLNYRFLWPVNLSSRQISKEVDFSEARNQANKDPLKIKRIPEDVWTAELSVELKKFDDQTTLVSISYTNLAIEGSLDFETTLFDCRFAATLSDIDLAEFSDDYLYEGYKQRYFYDFRNVNCQAYWQEYGKKFYTEHYGYFKQEDVRPKDTIKEIELRFSSLASAEDVLGMLPRLVTTMKGYLARYENDLRQEFNDAEFQPREGKKQRTWAERKKLISDFETLIRHVEEGVDLVRSENNVLGAFLRTNETFANYYENKRISNAGWRVFQLIFFLASIKSIVKHEDLDTAIALHVDTGGGKSEAYFALVIFTTFLDRTRGKEDGVSALVKFPLRMVSVDQLARISSMMMHAEAVRKTYYTEFPGENFSVGYFVGGQSIDFPNLYKNAKERFAPTGSSSQPLKSIILSECPLCGRTEHGTLRMIDDVTHCRLMHKCDKCGEKFGIYISDGEIFRWRPSVVISTVDKWAALSQQRRVRNLLGGRGSYCPNGHGFIPSGDQCEEDREEAFQCENRGSDEPGASGPSLSIQDEMHLLKESFGTISAHFEGLLEAIVESTSEKKLKHFAMSATLNGTPKQIKELYRKESLIVPGRCPEGVGSDNDFFFTKLATPKRLIFGLKPNVRDNHYASLRSLLHFAEFTTGAQKRFNTDANSFCEKYELDTAIQAQRLISQFLIYLSYHIKKQDAVEMKRLRDEVVTSQLKSSSNAEIQSFVLTGDSHLNELKQVIDAIKSQVEEYIGNDQGGDIQSLMALHATSVISHGVDLEELNFMIFQGLPYSTSEYVQALSRVGRKHLGIVLLWFYPDRVRDDSFYRNFRRYHETLDHQVKPVPVNRLSRLGLYQTINSMFCASVINYLSNKKGRPLYNKADIAALSISDQQDLVGFIGSVYSSSQALDIDISREVNERINQIYNSKERKTAFFPNILADSDKYFYRNQLGMRGIQQKLVLEIDAAGLKKLEK